MALHGGALDGGALDCDALAQRLLDRLGRLRMTLAVAESVTGGLVAACITEIPGASQCFRGGIVAYATASKADVLGVPADVLAGAGPVAAVTAAAMAEAVRTRFGADLGVATTGVAGPLPVGAIRPGIAFVAAALPGRAPVVRSLDLSGDRRRIRTATARAALLLAGEFAGAECGE